MDALWKEHEVMMRATHKFTTAPGDDLAAPRLTQFTVTKGYELEDPWDLTSGLTGRVMYVLNEAYVHPDGVTGHLGMAWPAAPDLHDNLMRFATSDNGVYLDLGDTRVTSTDRP